MRREPVQAPARQLVQVLRLAREQEPLLQREQVPVAWPVLAPRPVLAHA
jgi:hypothetical protein